MERKENWLQQLKSNSSVGISFSRASCIIISTISINTTTNNIITIILLSQYDYYPSA